MFGGINFPTIQTLNSLHWNWQGGGYFQTFCQLDIGALSIMATPSDGGGQTFSNQNTTSYFNPNPRHSPNPSSSCILGRIPFCHLTSSGYLLPGPSVQKQHQTPYSNHLHIAISSPEGPPDKVPPHSAAVAKRLGCRSTGLGKTKGHSDQHQLPPGSC